MIQNVMSVAVRKHASREKMKEAVIIQQSKDGYDVFLNDGSVLTFIL